MPRYVEYAGLRDSEDGKTDRSSKSDTQLKARRELEDLVEDIVDQIHKEEEKSMIKIQELKSLNESQIPNMPFQKTRVSDMIQKEEKDLNDKISRLLNNYDQVVYGIDQLDKGKVLHDQGSLRQIKDDSIKREEFTLQSKHRPNYSENEDLNEILRRLEQHEKEQREIFEQMKQNKTRREEPKLVDEKDRYVDVLPVRPDYIDMR